MHYVFFLYIILLSFSLQCMEHKVTQSTLIKPLSTLTQITSPLYCSFVDNHQAVIAGKNGCCIIDVIENKEITKITDLVFSYDSLLKLKVHPNKEKILFFHTQNVTMYNIKTKHKECEFWPDIHIKDVLFNPLDNETTFLFFNIKNKPTDYICKNNYHTNTQQYIDLKKSFPFYNTIHHPTQPFIINNYNGYISYIENFLITLKQYALVEISHCHFNHDGSKMIFQCHTKAHIGTEEKEENWKSIEEKEAIANCIFHPNENIVMTLSFNNTIGYWDAIKTHLVYKQTIEDNSCPSHDIACSPYGKHLLIMREEECVIIPIPEEIIWYNRMPYLLFLLKQCIPQANFPQELLMTILQNIQHGLSQKNIIFTKTAS